MMLLLAALVHANADPCEAAIVEYRHLVELDGANAGTRTERFRFAAPVGSCESILLPRRLDGMKLDNGDLVVTEGRMTRLSSMTLGQMLIVSRTEDLSGADLSGDVPEPAFPIDFMVVEVSVPERARVSIWTPPDAKVEVRKRAGARFFRASFGSKGRLVWSTEVDWWEVGSRLQKAASKQVVTKRDLKKLGDFAADLDGMSIEAAMKRVRDRIELDPIEAGWDSARPLSDVLEQGRGTAAERGVALLTLLRGAGYTADPVVVQPDRRNEAGLTVPGLAPFRQVGVRVQMPNGSVAWIDPVVPITRAERVPRGFRGALVLAAGDMPQVLADNLLPDGTVQIDADLELDYAGHAELELNIAADADATLALREILLPLKSSVRKQWLTDLLSAARPEATDVQIQVFGVDDPSQPLGMRVTFADQVDVRKGGELIADFPAALALQLARVLPPNVVVSEQLRVHSKDLDVYATRALAAPIDPQALVRRRVVFTADGVTLHTLAHRPHRTPLPQDTTGETLYRASEHGPTLFLFAAPNGGSAKRVRGKAHDVASQVVEAQFWFALQNPTKAEALLQNLARSTPADALLKAMREQVPLGEHLPWTAVWDELSDPDRLKLVEALEAQGDRREAWSRATQLIKSQDPLVAVQALVQVARIQGVRPSGNHDPEAQKAWRKPLLLLQRAATQAAKAAPDTTIPELEVGFTAELLRGGSCDLAESHARLLIDDPGLRSKAVIAEWRACRGELGATDELEALITDSDYDPVVIRSAIRAWQKAGRSKTARRWSLLAARLLETDQESWIRASELSVVGGDLATAVYAARQASDLEPRAMTAAIPLQLLASLAGDSTNAVLATQRANGFRVSKEPLPLSIPTAETFIEPEQRLAFLRTRDAEVMADATLLGERLALHEALGDRVSIQRDAAWLAKHHQRPKAAVSAFRATADTLWSTHALAALEKVLRDESARNARMEFGLFTGIGDPYADARTLGASGSAELVLVAKDDPDRLLAGSEWPLALDDPEVTTPFGFEPAPLLGAVDGAVGFRNRDANVSVIASVAGDELPPPLNGVFTLGRTIARYESTEMLRLVGRDTVGFVARRTVGDVTFWGLAPTPQLARFALLEAINAQGGG